MLPPHGNFFLLQVCLPSLPPQGDTHTSEDPKSPCHPSGGKFLARSSMERLHSPPQTSPEESVAAETSQPSPNLSRRICGSRGIFPRRANDNTAPVCFCCSKEPGTSAPRSHLKDNQASMLAKQLCGRQGRGGEQGGERGLYSFTHSNSHLHSSPPPPQHSLKYSSIWMVVKRIPLLASLICGHHARIFPTMSFQMIL